MPSKAVYTYPIICLGKGSMTCNLGCMFRDLNVTGGVAGCVHTLPNRHGLSGKQWAVLVIVRKIGINTYFSHGAKSQKTSVLVIFLVKKNYFLPIMKLGLVWDPTAAGGGLFWLTRVRYQHTERPGLQQQARVSSSSCYTTK